MSPIFQRYKPEGKPVDLTDREARQLRRARRCLCGRASMTKAVYLQAFGKGRRPPWWPCERHAAVPADWPWLVEPDGRRAPMSPEVVVDWVQHTTTVYSDAPVPDPKWRMECAGCPTVHAYVKPEPGSRGSFWPTLRWVALPCDMGHGPDCDSNGYWVCSTCGAAVKPGMTGPDPRGTVVPLHRDVTMYLTAHQYRFTVHLDEADEREVLASTTVPRHVAAADRAEVSWHVLSRALLERPRRRVDVAWALHGDHDPIPPLAGPGTRATFT